MRKVVLACRDTVSSEGGGSLITTQVGLTYAHLVKEILERNLTQPLRELGQDGRLLIGAMTVLVEQDPSMKALHTNYLFYSGYYLYPMAHWRDIRH